MRHLLAIGHVNEIAHQLVVLAAGGDTGTPLRHGLWMQLCAFAAVNAPKLSGLDFGAVIQCALSRYPNESGRLWCTFADFFTRQGHFERARHVYECGLRKVPTVRDFSSVFGAYVKFEEAIIAAQIKRKAIVGSAFHDRAIE